MNVDKQLRSVLGAHDIAASALGLSPDSFVPGDIWMQCKRVKMGSVNEMI